MGSPSFARPIKSSTTCVALHKTFHCDKDKLTSYLVGIVSVSQKISDLLSYCHSIPSVLHIFHLLGVLWSECSMLGSGIWRTLLLRLPVPDPIGSGWTECSMLWSGLLLLIYVTCRMKCESTLLSAFYRMKILYRWSRLVVSFCILFSDWFLFLGSDWLIGRKWRLLIGQISWLLIGWTHLNPSTTRL